MRQGLVVALLLALQGVGVLGMKLNRPWTSQHWCESVVLPHWPFAYSKGELVETKGRVASNKQDMGHSCETRGAHTKCHICEDIICDIDGGGNKGTCNYQLQGVDYGNLPLNVPTVSDAPWSVGGKHRYDFGGGSHVCVLLNGECTNPRKDKTDFSGCQTRCWGHMYPSPTPFTNDWAFDDSVRWTYSKKVGTNGLPQGVVTTLTGGGNGAGRDGYRDGALNYALFRNPQSIAVDKNGYVYVADTGNHCIRMIIEDTGTTVSTFVPGTVSTFAGKCGETNNKPFKDDCKARDATFSSPKSLTVYDDNGNTVVIVADTDNHKIRKVYKDGNSQWQVTTLSGLKGCTYLDQYCPRAGFADGAPTFARFNSPTGVAADRDGTVYVADRDNHVIRRILPDGTTDTLAGTLERDSTIPGCTEPCLRGVAGFDDGSLLTAKFNSPSDVSIGLDSTVVVTDDDRVRRVTFRNQDSNIQGVASRNRVVTIAGGLQSGYTDGYGEEARFSDPQGVMMTSDGRIYVADTSNCRIRQITSAFQNAKDVTCSDSAIDIVRPSGCSSYDPHVGAYELQVSSAAGNILYNHGVRSDAVLDGENFEIGRYVKDCQGVPPLDGGKQFTGKTAGPQSGSIVESFDYKEDTDDETEIMVNCPANCRSSAGGNFKIYGGDGTGTGAYTDYSSICEAAIHAGAITDSGGLVVVTILDGKQSYGASTANTITSKSRATQWFRSFSVAKYDLAVVNVQTIAGKPSAGLDEVCGFKDTQPPLESQFFRPTGVAVFIDKSLTDTDFLYVADSQNHAIRKISAVCSQICENGGRCIGPEKCKCPEGWSGTDCTKPVCSTPCGGRTVCTAPNQCSCVPGYENEPSCDKPLCVQDCQHGGLCSAPDTCSCSFGWFDANCTTPVCSQTCGNGANCTAPNTCTCPSQWKGPDCRTPVCKQDCGKYGSCIAPDTCMCHPDWSGFDCSWPVAMQAFLVVDKTLPLKPTYYPCSIQDWCDSTNEFDCKQEGRVGSLLQVEWGGKNRAVTGHKDNPGSCVYLELDPTTDTYFQYELSTRNHTKYYRHTPKSPYRWDGGNPWSSPSASTSDRQVALAELRLVPQGKYMCANNGDVNIPNTCVCQKGWVGFDCRIPVCRQGYFEEGQDGRQPLWGSKYYPWHGERNPSLHGQGGYECSIRAHTRFETRQCNFSSDGTFKSSAENCYTYIHNHPNFYTRYMDGDPLNQVFLRYHIWSPSADTPVGWPALHKYVPNPIDQNQTDEGWRRPGWWETTGLPWKKGANCIPEYARSCANAPTKVADRWVHRDNSRLDDFEITDDTDFTYRARVTYYDDRVDAVGRWISEGGECVDKVLRGCYNNGTCIAPDTCLCATGWTGSNCLQPKCDRPCLNNGNCTLPNTCTCEKGWSGQWCETPLCAQECKHGGKCVAPDTCNCSHWPSVFRDMHIAGGRPLFREPNGDPQLTGWTGYDCNTPICTQAKEFVLNDWFKLDEKNSAKYKVKADNNIYYGSVQLGGNGWIIYGDDPTNNLQGQPAPPPYASQKVLQCLQPGGSTVPYENLNCDGMVVRNDGKSFQAGCEYYRPPEPYDAYDDQNGYFLNDTERGSYPQRTNQDSKNPFPNYIMKRNPLLERVSDKFLCNKLVWKQGDYLKGRYIRVNHNFYEHSKDYQVWTQGTKIPGEGIYACYNRGTCILPDKCICPDGYSGFDCQIPECRHMQNDQILRPRKGDPKNLVGCVNGGICAAKDHCECPVVDSVLDLKYTDLGWMNPQFQTGYNGTDCSIPMCVQGWFDPSCQGVTPGGEGCFRCANGGNCTAPDFCTCAEGWTGFDCKTPVCRRNARKKEIYELDTVDPIKVIEYENDPCGMKMKTNYINGAMVGRGNCTEPGICQCLCFKRVPLDPESGEVLEEPWQDPLNRPLPPGVAFGDRTKECMDGYQGGINGKGQFVSCHMRIKVPTWLERYSVTLIVVSVSLILLGALVTWQVRKYLKKKRLMEKIEKRRSRRSSEEERRSKDNVGAFNAD